VKRRRIQERGNRKRGGQEEKKQEEKREEENDVKQGQNMRRRDTMRDRPARVVTRSGGDSPSFASAHQHRRDPMAIIGGEMKKERGGEKEREKEKERERKEKEKEKEKDEERGEKEMQRRESLRLLRHRRSITEGQGKMMLKMIRWCSSKTLLIALYNIINSKYEKAREREGGKEREGGRGREGEGGECG